MASVSRTLFSSLHRLLRVEHRKLDYRGTWPTRPSFQGLAAEMTEEERAAAGIDDLSPAQQQYLDAWLRDRFGAEPAVADPATVQPGAAVVAAEQASEADLAARENAIEAEVERRVAEELAAVQAAEEAEEE